MGTLNSSAAILREQFRVKGWAILPQAVPAELMRNLARWIEVDNQDFATLVGDQQPSWDEPSEAVHAVSTRIHATVADVFGWNLESVDGCITVFEQGASNRHVHLDGLEEIQHSELGWHQLPHYQMLTGAYCGDLTGVDSASMTVVDGGPHLVAKFFRDSGRRYFGVDGQVAERTALRRELADFLRSLEARAHPLETKVGDAIVVHGLMPHGVQRNDGSEPRRVLNSRLGIPPVSGIEALIAPFTGWPNF